MACSSHGLLGASSTPGGDALLLGLTDDVDCAVVRVSISTQGTNSAEDDRGAGPERAIASEERQCGSASGGMGMMAGGQAAGNTAGAPRIEVLHVRSIPALAYVAAGKVQRKHMLLAEPGAGRKPGR